MTHVIKRIFFRDLFHQQFSPAELLQCKVKTAVDFIFCKRCSHNTGKLFPEGAYGHIAGGCRLFHCELSAVSILYFL